MKVSQITAERERLDQTRARLEKRQKMVNIKERKVRLKKVLELGDLIVKAELENLEAEILFGALLEIKDLSASKETIKKWATRRELWLNQNLSRRLIISIKSEPSEEVRSMLKSRKFRWNAFRQEWYGFGQKEELSSVLGIGNAEITEVAE